MLSQEWLNSKFYWLKNITHKNFQPFLNYAQFSGQSTFSGKKITGLDDFKEKQAGAELCQAQTSLG